MADAFAFLLLLTLLSTLTHVQWRPTCSVLKTQQIPFKYVASNCLGWMTSCVNINCYLQPFPTFQILYGVDVQLPFTAIFHKSDWALVLQGKKMNDEVVAFPRKAWNSQSLPILALSISTVQPANKRFPLSKPSAIFCCNRVNGPWKGKSFIKP